MHWLLVYCLPLWAQLQGGLLTARAAASTTHFPDLYAAMTLGVSSKAVLLAACHSIH